MSRSVRNSRTPTFRFNRNDDDLLEEVYESESGIGDCDQSSIGTVDTLSIGEQSIQSLALSVTPPKERSSSVKEFLTAKLNKAKSLDHDEGNKISDSATAKWFHEIKGKIKEKIEDRKKDKEIMKSNEELRKIGIDSVTIKNKELPFKSIENNLNNEELSIESIDTEKETVTHSIPQWTPLDSRISNIESDFNNEFTEITENDLLIDSFPDAITSEIESSFPSDVREHIYDNNQWGFSKLFYIISCVIAIVSLIIALTSPLPSFVNGLLYGAFITILILVVSAVFVSSSFLFTKVDPKSVSKSKSFSLKKEDDRIYKGWMYEFIGDYEHRRDIGFYKTELIYARLQGSNFRLSKPKQNIKKIKFESNSLPVFTSQRIYDLSKMKDKRVTLLLPKSVKNRKKYIWSKKYPMCLHLEDNKTKNSIKLVLFIRNCREKEEWFWKLRAVTDGSRSPTPMEEKKTAIVSGPPSPRLTGDVITQEIEHLPRAQSLDFGTIPNATYSSSAPVSPSTPVKELHILSKHIDYDQFIKTALNFKSQQLSSLAWFNAFIGRVCFDVLNEQFWSNWVAAKFQRKLRKLRLPYFIETLTISEIDLGSNLPKFNHVPKPPMVDARGLWIDFEITYSGGFTMTLETKLNLMKLKDQGTVPHEIHNFSSDMDLSDNESDSILTSSEEETDEQALDPDDADSAKKQQKLLKFVDKIASSQYFQKATENKYIKRAMEGVSNCPLILTVQIQTLNGTLVFNIPPPPTDRLWYGFRGNPDLVLSARPKLGEHEVSMHHVTDLIERKLRAEFAKVLVMPNMDDMIIPIMMSNTDQFINIVP